MNIRASRVFELLVNDAQKRCSNIIVRCCIYLTTYDWINSFLKITMKAEPENKIKITGQWKIPFLRITIEADCSIV